VIDGQSALASRARLARAPQPVSQEIVGHCACHRLIHPLSPSGYCSSVRPFLPGHLGNCDLARIAA
jgi:hypothetical protein